MTPIQETANAVSMLFPVALCWLYSQYAVTANMYTFCLTIGTTLHFPASFAYHVYCSCSSDIHTAEVIKKIDISMVSCTTERPWHSQDETCSKCWSLRHFIYIANRFYWQCCHV